MPLLRQDLTHNQGLTEGTKIWGGCGIMHPQKHDFQTQHQSWRPPRATDKEQAI